MTIWCCPLLGNTAPKCSKLLSCTLYAILGNINKKWAVCHCNSFDKRFNNNDITINKTRIIVVTIMMMIIITIIISIAGEWNKYDGCRVVDGQEC